jgi:Mg2+-importing ATPase
MNLTAATPGGHPALHPPAPGGQGEGGGLASREARARLATVGPNLVAGGHRLPLVLQLLIRFRNPLVLLLLGAAVVSGITGDRRSAVVISAVVVMSLVLDFVQEHRAGRAADRLRQAAAVGATVIRDGAPREVPASEIVPGDVVLLAAGDLVPADGRLVESRDLFVNQAVLTGEPYPVDKRAEHGDADPPATDPPSTDRPDSVFMGSSVVSGSARLLVGRTGKSTMLGQIGATLRREPPPSSFELGTRSFGLLIVSLATAMVLFVILVNAWRGRPWLESFLFAIALAVGLTPELLPMIVSVTLSRGAIRMSARKVLVKRLAAIHDLGSMDVLCTDKTGTLTEARIRLERCEDGFGVESRRVLGLAGLNSLLQSGLRSPLDDAIAAACEHEIVPTQVLKLDEVPFDFERRRVSVLLRAGAAAPVLVVKGAFEDVLACSTRTERASAEAVGSQGSNPLGADPDTEALDDLARAALRLRLEKLAGDGFRLLGVAWRRLEPAQTSVGRQDERELVFAGFVAFQDPPKESARHALAHLRELGVAVKVITGDNELVAEHVCRALELALDGVLTGPDLQALDDQALAARVERTTLFCRVTPAQKNRIILALKQRKHVVGYLGDGINDAPALHTADVGISVDGAVDVAREAADLILLEHDLGVLRDGVVEGRRTLGNILKYILMGTSSNFGNMFSMAGAAIFLPFLPMLPIQILVNNFLYDLSEIPIPTDQVDAADVARPRRWDMRFIRRFMLTIGPVSSIFDFLTFFVLYRVLHASEAVFHTGWFVESMCTQVLVIFVIRTRGNPLRSRPSRTLATVSLAVVAAALVLPLTPLGHTLGFVRPPTAFLAALAVMVAAYLAAVEAVKRWFYARLAPT